MKSSLSLLTLSLAIGLTLPLGAAPVVLTVKTELLPPSGDIANGYGKALACNERHIVVGAPGAATGGGSEHGAVYVYDATTLKLVRKLRPTQPVNGEKFGSALALDGSTLYVGAPGHSKSVAGGGAVHAFDLATGARKWTFASNRAGEGLGGHALAVACDLVASGQPFSNFPGAPSESGYVRLIHRRSAADMGDITAPSPAAGDRCGFALAVSGHFLAIGVPSSNYGGTDKGLIMMVDTRTYLLPTTYFQNSNTAGLGMAIALSGPRIWARSGFNLFRFRPIDGSMEQYVSMPNDSSSEFGKTLAANGSLVACSDPQKTGGAKVYGYDLDSANMTWELNDPNAGQPASRFGRTIALSLRHVVVGDGVGLPRVTVAELPVLPWHAQRIKQFITSGINAQGVDAQFAAVTAVEAAVNTQGEVLAAARMTDGDTTPASNRGLWSDMTIFDLVAKTGSPFGSQKLTRLDTPVFNGTDRALFLAHVSGTNARVLMEDQGASVAELLREGATIMSGRVLGKIHQVVQPYQAGVPSGANRFAMAASYRTGVMSVTRDNDSAIFSSSTIGTVSELVREGAPGAAMGAPYGQITPRLGRAHGKVIFNAALQGVDSAFNSGLFIHTIGTGNEGIVFKGSTPNQVPNAKLRTFLGESCNGNGRHVYRASLSGVATSENEGVWSNLNNADISQLLVRKGWPAHGLPAGIYVNRFLRVFMTGDSVIVWATLRGLTVNSTNNHAVWRYTFNGPELILRTGEHAPGCGGARYGRILNVTASPFGSFAIHTTLTGCPSASNQAVFENTVYVMAAAFQRQPQLAARKGMVIERNGPKRVTSLIFGRGSIDATGFGAKGHGEQVCEKGPVFGARFSDGSSQLLMGRQ